MWERKKRCLWLAGPAWNQSGAFNAGQSQVHTRHRREPPAASLRPVLLAPPALGVVDCSSAASMMQAEAEARRPLSPHIRELREQLAPLVSSSTQTSGTDSCSHFSFLYHQHGIIGSQTYTRATWRPISTFSSIQHWTQLHRIATILIHYERKATRMRTSLLDGTTLVPRPSRYSMHRGSQQH